MLENEAVSEVVGVIAGDLNLDPLPKRDRPVSEKVIPAALFSPTDTG